MADWPDVLLQQEDGCEVWAQRCHVGPSLGSNGGGGGYVAAAAASSSMAAAVTNRGLRMLRTSTAQQPLALPPPPSFSATPSAAGAGPVGMGAGVEGGNPRLAPTLASALAARWSASSSPRQPLPLPPPPPPPRAPTAPAPPEQAPASKAPSRLRMLVAKTDALNRFQRRNSAPLAAAAATLLSSGSGSRSGGDGGGGGGEQQATVAATGTHRVVADGGHGAPLGRGPAGAWPISAGPPAALLGTGSSSTTSPAAATATATARSPAEEAGQGPGPGQGPGLGKVRSPTGQVPSPSEPLHKLQLPGSCGVREPAVGAAAATAATTAASTPTGRRSGEGRGADVSIRRLAQVREHDDGARAPAAAATAGGGGGGRGGSRGGGGGLEAGLVVLQPAGIAVSQDGSSSSSSGAGSSDDDRDARERPSAAAAGPSTSATARERPSAAAAAARAAAAGGDGDSNLVGGDMEFAIDDFFKGDADWRNEVTWEPTDQVLEAGAKGSRKAVRLSSGNQRGGGAAGAGSRNRAGTASADRASGGGAAAMISPLLQPYLARDRGKAPGSGSITAAAAAAFGRRRGGGVLESAMSDGANDRDSDVAIRTASIRGGGGGGGGSSGGARNLFDSGGTGVAPRRKSVLGLPRLHLSAFYGASADRGSGGGVAATPSPMAVARRHFDTVSQASGSPAPAGLTSTATGGAVVAIDLERSPLASPASHRNGSARHGTAGGAAATSGDGYGQLHVPDLESAPTHPPPQPVHTGVAGGGAGGGGVLAKLSSLRLALLRLGRQGSAAAGGGGGSGSGGLGTANTSPSATPPAAAAAAACTPRRCATSPLVVLDVADVAEAAAAATAAANGAAAGTHHTPPHPYAHDHAHGHGQGHVHVQGISPHGLGSRSSTAAAAAAATAAAAAAATAAAAAALPPPPGLDDTQPIIVSAGPFIASETTTMGTGPSRWGGKFMATMGPIDRRYLTGALPGGTGAAAGAGPSGGSAAAGAGIFDKLWYDINTAAVAPAAADGAAPPAMAPVSETTAAPSEGMADTPVGTRKGSVSHWRSMTAAVSMATAGARSVLPGGAGGGGGGGGGGASGAVMEEVAGQGSGSGAAAPMPPASRAPSASGGAAAAQAAAVAAAATAAAANAAGPAALVTVGAVLRRLWVNDPLGPLHFFRATAAGGAAHLLDSPATCAIAEERGGGGGGGGSATAAATAASAAAGPSVLQLGTPRARDNDLNHYASRQANNHQPPVLVFRGLRVRIGMNSGLEESEVRAHGLAWDSTWWPVVVVPVCDHYRPCF